MVLYPFMKVRFHFTYYVFILYTSESGISFRLRLDSNGFSWVDVVPDNGNSEHRKISQTPVMKPKQKQK